MATRRRSRRKTISGNLTDVQKRIRYLETRPSATRLASKAVATRNLALRAVDEDVVADNAIVRRSIANAAVGTAEIEQDSITNALLATNSVNADSIAPGEVGTSELANDSVTNDKLATDSVNSDSILAGSVGTAELAGGIPDNKISGMSSSKLIGDVQDDQIAGISGSKIIGGLDGALIIDGTVDTPELASFAVTTAKIDDLAVTRAKIAQYTISSDNIAGNAIIGRAGSHPFGGPFHLQNFSIGSDDIFSASITTNKIDTGAVTTGKIGDLQVTRAKLANLAVNTAKIDDLAVTRDKINNSAVGTAQIGELQVTNSKLGAGSITQGKIAAGAAIVTGVVAGTGTVVSSATSNGGGRLVTVSASFGSGAFNVAAGNHTHTGGTTVPSHTHPLPGVSYVIGPSGNHAGHSGTNTGSHQHGLTLTGNTLSNTSTLKAKKEIQDHSFDTKKLLTLNLKKYKYKNEYRSLQDNLNREWMYGYIAEEVQEAGLEEILGYDSKGEVASLQYGTLVTLAIELIKEQQSDIDLLKEEIQRLKEKI
jgi:hypothetical protein